jgi:FixJ family two-component response regulator
LRSGEQRVYVVDDDEALRDSLVWLVESQGFAVEQVQTP